MRVERLSALDPGALLQADVAIVGGGPAGLTVARELFGANLDVLILESGELEESPAKAALNRVENVGEPKSNAQWAKRNDIFAGASASWRDRTQPFEVRNRILGGSSHTWAGKSAAFQPIDFQRRAWAPHSGWPVSHESLAPYIDRAAAWLNLGPNRYDDSLWELLGRAPEKDFDPDAIVSFFWQFARSRTDSMDIMRFGPEFLAEDAPNVRVLLDATVTHVDTNQAGTAFEALEVASASGVRAKVRARAVVLAAGAVENARLLLASNRVVSTGVGNAHGVVGRFLMDHPSATVARFRPEDFNAVLKRFGFYGVPHGGRTRMYMHGGALSPAAQEREELLNCAFYVSERRAPDDPWDAIKRLIRRKSAKPFSDMLCVARSPSLIATGVSMHALQHRLMPEKVRSAVINAVLALHPALAAREFQSRGVPHKLSELMVDAITEQVPDPESRITLSSTTDAFGAPLPRADWKINAPERRSVVRLGQILAEELPKIGLPAPELEPWVAEGRLEDGVFIDMAHPMGTTRMSADPKNGVVDADCKLHGVEGVYVAGGSVFPTSGHANPTLMITAFAVRLADHLKATLGADGPPSAAAGERDGGDPAEVSVLEFK